jgi:hypothetical protein
MYFIEKICDDFNWFERAWEAFSISLIVFIVFSPPFFSLTDFIFTSLRLPRTIVNGHPTLWGLLFHSFLIFVIYLCLPVCDRGE